MKNRLSDLNDHLFAQIERLSDEDLSREELDKEVRRGDAIVGIATAIIQNAALQLKKDQMAAEYAGLAQLSAPALEVRR